ncbi:soluble quino protein glucose dehydrogenase [Ramaria rubella]|nr:soluble quino protein glucose dehydrogenase [Ramaria rubella]
MFISALISRILVVGLFALNPCSGSFQPSGALFQNPVTLAPGFSAQVLFSNLTLPRGITFDSANNLLVVEHGVGVTAFVEALNRTGWERTIVVPSVNFTQGIQVDGSQLYVSTPGEVLLFNYDATTKTVRGQPQTIINGLPPDGDLTTHTLQIESTPQGNNLLVASGPFTNIDPTARNSSSGRSQIRRFSLPAWGGGAAPQQYLDGELIAFGIRNPAGFAFHPTDSATLFAVENGASIDNVTGLTAKFVNDNPADELESVNLLRPAISYGFPDCTTLWNPLADPVGDPQYTRLSRGDQISLLLEPGRGEDFCRDIQNNQPPILSFQAHSVPLDIKFYLPPSQHPPHAFPSAYQGDAFVSFHGSFDRIPPTGYGVIHIPFSGSGPKSSNYTFLIQVADLTPCPGQCIRPVGLAFGPDGRLYISSDSSGELFVLEAT